MQEKEERSQIDCAQLEPPTLIDDSKFFESSDKFFEVSKSDSNEIEFIVDKTTLAIFQATLELATEYIDILCNNNTMILYTETSGQLFCARIALKHPVKSLDFRISSQLFRNVNQNHSLIRISVSEALVDVKVYKTDLNARPFILKLAKSIAYSEHFDLVKEIFEDSEFGKDHIFLKILPAISKIYKNFKSITPMGIVIQDGVAYIDTPECKAYADTNVKGVNIVLPSSILNVISRLKTYDNCRYNIKSSYNILRSGQFIYGWRSQRLQGDSLYSKVKEFKFQYKVVTNLTEITNFIKSIKLAKNKDQSAFIDFDSKEFNASEGGLTEYIVPFDCGEIETDSNSETILSHKVSIDMNTFVLVSSMINLGVISVAPKYIMLNKSEVDEMVGQILYTFVLQVRR